MKTLSRIFAMVSLALAVGCSTTPDRVDMLEQARVAVNQLNNDPLVGQVAGNELEQARDALARADTGLREHQDLELVEHDAYLALRHAEIAEQRIEEARIRDQIEDSEAERAMVLLEAREREAQRARAVSRAKVLEAERAEALARSKTHEAERNALEARLAKDKAAAAVLTVQALADELETLKAEKTERGMVLTLGDVLFNTDESNLKPGAEKTLDRLAAFLADNPDRNLLIEGHTDSRGDREYNEDLSYRRANAVRTALIGRGIAPARMAAKGLGESYPVATNDTNAGRQENRRVEIVISDKAGQFPHSVEHETAQN